MARANAIAAKVRSLHGEQLDERDYAELLSRRNVPEIAAYLKNETHYKYALRDVRENNVHRGQLEDLLRKDVFREVRQALSLCGPQGGRRSSSLH